MKHKQRTDTHIHIHINSNLTHEMTMYNRNTEMVRKNKRVQRMLNQNEIRLKYLYSIFV